MTSAGQGLKVMTIANQLLQAVVEHWSVALAAALPDVVALPERRYVHAGDPSSVPWDCEQLTVSLNGIGFGPAQDAAPTTPRAGGPANVLSVRHAVFDLALVRCIPTPSGRNATPPSMADLQAAGDRYMRDAGLLSQALVRWGTRTRGLLVNDGASSVQLGVIEPGEVAGGFVALTAAALVTAGDLE